VINARANGAARLLCEQIHSLVTPLLFPFTLGLKLVFDCCGYAAVLHRTTGVHHHDELDEKVYRLKGYQ
jgi:hypothetical protein